MKNVTSRWLQWLVRFVQLQLFLSLISLPLLLAWGLPISLLSPLGNLFFGPVITLFLLLSSLIFFSQLLTLPNGWLITCLEYLTAGWLKVMHADNGRWLIGFIKPTVPCILLLLGATLVIMHYRRAGNAYINIGMLATVLLGTGWYLKSVATPPSQIMQVPCNKGHITVIHHNKQLVVIDPGFLGQRTSAASWAHYTLMPAIMQATGTTCIDHLIVLQPGSMAFAALERLCTCMGVKNLYLIMWDGTLSKGGWFNFYALKQTATAKGINVVRIARQPITVALAPDAHIQIAPLEDIITTATASFPALAVTGQIDKQEITLYSAKYRKQLTKNDVFPTTAHL